MTSQQQTTNKLKRIELRLIFNVFLDKFGYLPYSISSTALHVTARDYTWLHITVRDCTWIPANLHQNIYFSTFKSHTWINFLGLVNLSHKAVVFLLKFPLGQKVFHWRSSINISPSIIIDWFLVWFSFSVSLHWVERFFHHQYNPLRLISFPMGLGCSLLSSGFPSQFPIGLGGYSSSHTHTYTYTFV